jgi:hypothetical protein
MGSGSKSNRTPENSTCHCRAYSQNQRCSGPGQESAGLAEEKLKFKIQKLKPKFKDQKCLRQKA